jgi:hypothetical protein
MKFYKLFIALTLASTFSCDGDEANVETEEYVFNPAGYRMLTSSSQMSDVVDYKIKGVIFAISHKDGDTTYIQTTDSSFTTPEELCVGVHYNEIVQHATQPLYVEPGRYAYIGLKSGWNAAFKLDFSSSTIYKEMKMDSLVALFYKKK